MSSSFEFKTTRRIEFADTDMGRIVHFSRYFVYMETAEHELLASIGSRVHSVIDGREVAWPRVAATCDYVSPARFGDVLDITVRVTRLGRTSVTYQHTIAVGDRKVATGTVTAVCCELTDAGLASIPIPDRIRSTFEAGEST